MLLYRNKYVKLNSPILRCPGNPVLQYPDVAANRHRYDVYGIHRGNDGLSLHFTKRVRVQTVDAFRHHGINDSRIPPSRMSLFMDSRKSTGASAYMYSVSEISRIPQFPFPTPDVEILHSLTVMRRESMPWSWKT